MSQPGISGALQRDGREELTLPRRIGPRLDHLNLELVAGLVAQRDSAKELAAAVMALEHVAQKDALRSLKSFTCMGCAAQLPAGDSAGALRLGGTVPSNWRTKKSSIRRCP